MNLGQIKAQITQNVQNFDSDFSDSLNWFVERTQRRLRNLEVLGKEKYLQDNIGVYTDDQGAETDYGSTMAVPSDFKEIKEIWLQSIRNPVSGEYDDDFPEEVWGQLDPVAWAKMTENLQRQVGTPDRPVEFARIKDENDADVWVFSPLRGAWSVEMNYWQAPQVLTSDEQSNVYTEDYPDLMIYGGTSEGFRFVRNPEKAAEWEAEFKNLYDEIANAAKQADFRGNTLVTEISHVARVSY